MSQFVHLLTVLLKEMQKSGEFHNLEIAQLIRDCEHARAAVIMDGDRIIAYGAIEPHENSAWEIRRIFVAEDKRGNGHMRKVFEMLMCMVVPAVLLRRTLDARLFLISKNPAVRRTALKAGFVVVTKLYAPRAVGWAKRVGIGDRLPETAKKEYLQPSGDDGERW